MNTIGKVYLVGAGPGDPELLTLKAHRLLKTADVIAYDRLANPLLLSITHSDALLIDVGKMPKKHRRSQDEINTLLIEHAQNGRSVVRLKGGDPLVFGRGGEEAQLLAAHGVPFEIVPGISSALAVPAYAGIPVTQRHVSQSFTVVTGHSANPTDPHAVNWDDLPRHGTLVILMGVKNLPVISQRLIDAGRNPETPAAIIRWGTTSDQEMIVGTVKTLPALSTRFHPPAIIIIGDVVDLHQEIGWFQPHQFLAQIPPFLLNEDKSKIVNLKSSIGGV